MALDYKSALDAKAWALLEANATFIGANSPFPPGCRLKDDPKVPTQRAILRAPRDTEGQIRIEVQDSQPILAQTPRTLGMNSTTFTSATVDFGVPMTAKVVVTMIFGQKMEKTARLAAETLVRSIWTAAYPKFGLTYVTGFSINETRRLQKIDKAGPDFIFITQTLNFNLRPRLSQLV